MTAFLTRLSWVKQLLVWSHVLLLSLTINLPVYAAGEAATSTSDKVLADTAAALGLPKGALTSNNEVATTDNESGEAVTAPAESVKLPSIINGESTNNAQIETTPTPQKDNDIRERINGIFSEIDGLQVVTVSVTQGVVTLAGETAMKKKPSKRLV